MRKTEVIGFDPGFGDDKFAFRNEKGEIVLKKESSVVAKAPQGAVDMPLFEGERYYLGDIALARGSQEIIELDDYSSLEKTAPLFLWRGLKDYNIDKNTIKKIVTGLSFAQMNHGKSFLKRLSKFKINNETFDFTDKVLITPQGVGAKYAIDHYFPEGPETYLIIDIGMYTIDAVDVISGVVRPENVHGYKDEGVIRIARNIQDHIAEEFQEHVSLKEVKEILQEKSFFLAGEDYDLSEKIKELSEAYTKATIRNLQERFQREFKKYRRIYFVGGGAHFIDTSISKAIEVVPKPEFYNAIGNLLRGEKELKEA